MGIIDDEEIKGFFVDGQIECADCCKQDQASFRGTDIITKIPDGKTFYCDVCDEAL